MPAYLLIKIMLTVPYFQVLRKEIDVFQLRWYGYCMFRALASLHKQVNIVYMYVLHGFSLVTCLGFFFFFLFAGNSS